jgi:hypothetical protein
MAQAFVRQGWRVGNGLVDGARARLRAAPLLALPWLFGCAILSGPGDRGDGTVFTSAKGTCVLLTPENALHPVGACESTGRYDVQAVGRRYSYAQSSFQNSLRDSLWQYLRQTAYRVEALRGARVDVWVSAPVFRPENASFVAVVVAPSAGNVAVRLPFDMSAWRLRDEDVVLLGRDASPNARALAVGRLLVKPLPSQTEASFKSFLAEAKAATVRAKSSAWRSSRSEWPVAEIETRPFAELDLARLVSMAPGAKASVAVIERRVAPEPEGYKAKAFSFYFAP